MVPDVLALGLLVAPRDAACVALGGVHVGPAAIELALPVSVLLAPRRSAPSLFAVRGHRSSFGSKLALTAAYHVTTG
jgi:hypothetical protein